MGFFYSEISSDCKPMAEVLPHIDEVLDIGTRTRNTLNEESSAVRQVTQANDVRSFPLNGSLRSCCSGRPDGLV